MFKILVCLFVPVFSETKGHILHWQDFHSQLTSFIKRNLGHLYFRKKTGYGKFKSKQNNVNYEQYRGAQL